MNSLKRKYLGKFHWNQFLITRLSISQHWLKAITWINYPVAVCTLKRKGGQDDCPDRHWRHWRQASMSPVKIRAVNLTTFPFLCTNNPQWIIVASMLLKHCPLMLILNLDPVLHKFWFIFQETAYKTFVCNSLPCMLKPGCGKILRLRFISEHVRCFRLDGVMNPILHRYPQVLLTKNGLPIIIRTEYNSLINE